METNLTPTSQRDILRIVAEARQQRSDALGELIAVGGRKAIAALATRIDQALHILLMSPTRRTWAK